MNKPYHHPLCPCASAFAQLPSVQAVCNCEGVTEEEFKAERARIGRIEFISAGATRKR